MKIFVKIAFLSLAMSLSAPTIAGARNGYRLVFMDMSLKPSTEITTALINYFNSKFPAEMYDCNEVDRFIEFDLTYVKKRPKAITRGLVTNSLSSDKSSLKLLRKALRSYRDLEIDRGFDGLVAFRMNGEFYELTTIGAVDDDYERSYRVRSQQGMTAETLRAMFCGSLARLPYAYMD